MRVRKEGRSYSSRTDHNYKYSERPDHSRRRDRIPEAAPYKNQIEWMVKHGYAKQAAIMQMSGATASDFSNAIEALQKKRELQGPKEADE